MQQSIPSSPLRPVWPVVIQRVAVGLVAVGIFAVTGCQGLDGAAPPRPAELEDLTAHPWRLARLDRAFPVARTQSSFEFRADGRLEGNGGAAEFFGHFTLGPGGFHEETFVSDGTVTGLDFGNWTTATITDSFKFNDLDAGGQSREAGEPGLPGWTIYVDYDNDEILDNNRKNLIY